MSHNIANVIKFPEMDSISDPEYGAYQVENGNYARVLNSSLEKLCGSGLSGAQLSLVLFVIRKTYGYGKKFDRIATSQIADAIGVNKTTAARTLNRLVNAKVILRKSQRSPLSFNKYHFQWDLTELRDCSKGQSQNSPDCLESQTHESRDCLFAQTKIDQNSKQQKRIKQKIKENTKRKVSSDVKSDSKSIHPGYMEEPIKFDHPIKPADLGYQEPSEYPQKSTKQLQDENVDLARDKVKTGTPWGNLPIKLKVAAVFSAYNRRFDKKTGKGAFMENGKFNPTAENCAKRIKEGITLKTFNLVFDFGSEMTRKYNSGAIDEKSDLYFDAGLWANNRPIETIMRKENFHKYRSSAEDWEELQ